jgi:hypothetical protein
MSRSRLAPGAFRHRLLPGLALLCALGLPRPGLCQVNVEALRKQLTKEGIHGTLGGSITSYNGNTRGTELGGSTLVGYRSGRDLGYLNIIANYSNFAGEVQVANAFVHFRYNYKINEWLAAEAFTQAENDRFRRLRLRTLVGAGLRFSVAETEMVSLFYGVSYMYEHTELSESVADRPVRPDDVHRMNNYAALLIVLDPGRAALSNTIYFQPRFDDFQDVRLLDILSLDVSVTGRISASLQGTLRCESPVPPTLKPVDLMVKNMLGVSF